MRYAAFFLGVTAGVFVLAGAIMGLGIVAIATIFIAVAFMFVRDSRPLALLMIVASVGAGIAGGPFALPGALAGMASAVLAYRLDREKSLV